MKYSDIVNMTSAELDKLDYYEMREVASVLRDVANKRIKRFEKSDKTSPAFEKLKKKFKDGENIKFSTQGQDRNELRSTISTILSFTEAETGSVTKIKKIEKDFFNGFLKEDIPKDTSAFWKFYRKYAEKHQNLVATKMGSETTEKALAHIFNTTNMSNISEDEELFESAQNEVISDEKLSDKIFDYLSLNQPHNENDFEKEYHIKWDN